MNKENTLFAIVGVLAGFIGGFVFANTVNTRGAAATQVALGPAVQQQALPPGHPQIDGAAQQAPAVDMTQVRDAEKLADSATDNFDAQKKAGELNYEAQRYDDAIKFWTRAAKIKPDDYDLLVAVGNAAYDAQKFTDAERWYAQALARKPDEVNVRTDYGSTFMMRETPDYERAITEFKRSLSRDPRHVPTLQNLTLAYARKGDAANARTTLAKLEEVAPGTPAVASLKAEIEKKSAADGADAATANGGK